MRPRVRILPFLCILTVWVTGCGAPASTAVPPTPSQTPPPPQTPTAAATVTPTIVLELPTGTLNPTTPGVTPTASPPASGDLICKVFSQGVKNGAHFPPKARFDMGWQVRNKGDLDWDPATTRFTYFSGTRMYVSPSSSLQGPVPHGAVGLLVADMVAPKQPGTYKTVWSLWQGENDFCHVSLSIVVP